ncbi:magnesium protoporphyrin IX methyltransferase [Seohaeicola saemankumensis]|uniref:magnesium protoporphyrin IX methyltransferase n=1 Tax=Seohaeicola saemankumensis TaxID=481181 RepID=UPI001E512B9C|nr:magnesium protoporphyrin IX methyltransferase [Seohaeicola saemankumensis]MCD1627315.1 magnesium protoporphyrin IX methyltransferase [Seohaeicola saemankumensis]
MSYDRTLSRVETYFDKTATRTWERLTSDAPVSRIRETVRRGRDGMRARMLAQLPEDLRGARVLDAGCGAGQMTAELAARGADVMAVDISPSLVEIARKRLPVDLAGRVTFASGDMLADTLGRFDHVMAMDSLIYYNDADIRNALETLANRTAGSVVFTVAPRTTLLMGMWYAGKLFPRSDRSPVMIPHSPATLAHGLRGAGRIRDLGRISSGFYISQALEFSK